MAVSCGSSSTPLLRTESGPSNKICVCLEKRENVESSPSLLFKTDLKLCNKRKKYPSKLFAHDTTFPWGRQHNNSSEGA